MIFTHHAVHRYRQFHMMEKPDATDQDARAILEAHADSALKTGRTFRDDPLWRIEALGIELVVKHENGKNICVTVLPPPRFRGLSPIQAEAVATDLQETKNAIFKLKIELDEKVNPKQQQRRKEARREYHELLIERDLFCAMLKTMRYQLTVESSETSEALSVAIDYIRSKADSDWEAALLLEKIYRIRTEP